MSYLERLQRKAGGNANEEPIKGAIGSYAPFDCAPAAYLNGLPADCVAGLKNLANMATPQGVSAEAWMTVMHDAQRIVDQGWAAKALALGWSPLDLFGAVCDAAGDPYSDGLAVWLNGRKVLAISAVCATVENDGGRCYYTCRDQVGARPLWELG